MAPYGSSPAIVQQALGMESRPVPQSTYSHIQDPQTTQRHVLSSRTPRPQVSLPCIHVAVLGL
jgi:hypothetical protein